MGSLTEADINLTDENPTLVQLTGGTANVKGDYAEVIATSAATATMMRVRFNNSAGAGAQINQLCDIATGAALSESIIVANLQCGSAPVITAGAQPGYDYWIPVDIAAGTRLSARISDAVGADTVDISIDLYGGGAVGAGVTAIGANTAASAGTQVTAGNNAYGNWTEIEDSTTEAYRWVFPSIQTGGISWAAARNLVQVGTGAAASEVALQTFMSSGTVSEAVSDLLVQPIIAYSAIPSGTRLAVRIWGGGAANVFQVVLHGVK